MTEYNVDSTANAIENAADVLADKALTLRSIAKRMREDGDITRVSDAVSTLANTMNAVRLDLLVTRPLRETMKDR